MWTAKSQPNLEAKDCTLKWLPTIGRVLSDEQQQSLGEEAAEEG